MKLLSIFKTTSHQRFEIKPRYYDPIKEEIEERTSRIQRELDAENGVQQEGEFRSSFGGGSIKGSFASYRGMKSKDSSIFSTSSTIRTILFFGMITTAFGYMYIGPQVFTYLTVAFGVAGAVYFFFKFNRKKKNE